jgi:hypothetical protein
LERGLVCRGIGSPVDILVGLSSGRHAEALARRILRAYYRPLSPKVAERLKAIVDREGISGTDDLFWKAHVAAKRDPAAFGRMDSFLKLYGFSRNISFAALVGAVGLAGRAAYEWLLPHDAAGAYRAAGLAALALAVGVGMFGRYLKFYRLYGLEVLVTLAHDEGAER